MRLYQLQELVPAAQTDGRLRPARIDDLELLVEWHLGFCADTGLPADNDPEGFVRRRVGGPRFWVWAVGDQPVSMVAASPTVSGCSRIGHVYTPPEERGRGYGAAATSGATAAVLGEDAEHCLLYTQMQNAGSNRIYRRLGYRAAEERIVFRFTYR
jgi:predicted GNAT family acetyltransferase